MDGIGLPGALALFALTVAASGCASIVTGLGPSGEAISDKTHVRCPDCKELIRADASKCRYCGAALVPKQVG